MKIDIRHIAKLSRLRIEESEVEKFEREMLALIDMVENLPALSGDDSGLDPQNPMILRKDVVTESARRDDILKNAPASQSGCLVVPRIVE